MSSETVGTMRFWKEAGLQWILLPHAVPADLSLMVYGKKRQKTPETRLGERSPRTRQKPDYIPKPADQKMFVPQKGQTAEAERIVPLLWPKAWKELLYATKPGRVIWTYRELGGDLLHRDSPGISERRAFLQRLLTTKPTFPAGTHSFWPYCLSEDDLCDERAAETRNLFWAGVHDLGGRIVMILGEEAGYFLLRQRYPYTQSQSHGVHVTLFQAIPALCTDASLFARMHEMTCAVVARFGGLAS